MSSKETILLSSYLENTYTNFYDLPNTSPRCPQLLLSLPIVFLIQAGVVENARGSNLNKSWPMHELSAILFESMYAMGDGSELTSIDLAR